MLGVFAQNEESAGAVGRGSINKYQGFEGKRIAMHSLKGEDPDLEGMIDLFRETAAVGKYVMLCVDQGDSARGLLKGIERMGFDVGACEEDRTVYSSIFNEVLFGNDEELFGFQGVLNENFLFTRRAEAEGYVDVHNRLAAEGKSIEEGVEMNIYEVWKCMWGWPDENERNTDICIRKWR